MSRLYKNVTVTESGFDHPNFTNIFVNWDAHFSIDLFYNHSINFINILHELTFIVILKNCYRNDYIHTYINIKPDISCRFCWPYGQLRRCLVSWNINADVQITNREILLWDFTSLQQSRLGDVNARTCLLLSACLLFEPGVIRFSQKKR